MHSRYSWCFHTLTSLAVLASPLLVVDCTSPDRTFVPTNGGSSSGGKGGSAGAAGSSVGGASGGQGGSDAKPCTAHTECDDLNDCNGRESCEGGFCKAAAALAPDGNFCSVPGQTGQFFCTKGNCEPSRCGDGYTDKVGKEDCDDANDVAGDGCETGCLFSCSKAEDCADTNVCNGAEVCDSVTHTCKAGTPAADETNCGTSLWCNGGLCVAQGCGDGAVGGAEECDDNNAEDNDGCKRECTLTCKADADCGGGDLCVGKWSCDKTDPLKPICKSSGALDCTKPIDACHTSACDPELGCVQTLIDADEDKHASVELGACGDDCDDKVPTTYTGAPEICKDGVDNNCDKVVDEVQPTIWYLDCDGDGFAPAGAFGKEQCEPPPPPTGCPAGSVSKWTDKAPVTAETTDCYDGNANAKPGQTSWFAPAVTGTNYDYNCVSGNERLYTRYADGTSYTCGNGPILEPKTSTLDPKAMQTKAGEIGIRFCFGTSYWTTTSAFSVPACGATGTQSQCYNNGSGCVRGTFYNVAQLCH
jgi:cysteine-rich repeat protein